MIDTGIQESDGELNMTRRDASSLEMGVEDEVE